MAYVANKKSEVTGYAQMEEKEAENTSRLKSSHTSGVTRAVFLS
jgi:hypothetical protein